MTVVKAEPYCAVTGVAYLVRFIGTIQDSVSELLMSRALSPIQPLRFVEIMPSAGLYSAPQNRIYRVVQKSGTPVLILR